MKKVTMRLFSFVASFLILITFSARSMADVVLTLAPTAGTDLSNVHVGDTLHFNSFVSSADSGEFLLSANIHLLATNGIFDIFSGVIVPGWNDLLSTSPILALWTVRTSAAGTVDLFNGFTDCLGLPSDTTGCAVTNLGAYRPADSNRITFTVHDVPEPGSLALLGLGLAGLAYSRKRKAQPTTA